MFGLCADLQCVKSFKESVKSSSGWLENPLNLSRLLGRVFSRGEKAEHFEICSELFFKKKATFDRFFWWYIGEVFLRKEKRASRFSGLPLVKKNSVCASAHYCRTVLIIASMSAAFCLPEQFRFLRWLLTASACAMAVRAISSRCPSAVVGLCTTMQIFCRALIAQHLPTAP